MNLVPSHSETNSRRRARDFRSKFEGKFVRAFSEVVFATIPRIKCLTIELVWFPRSQIYSQTYIDMCEFKIPSATAPLPRTYWVLDGKFLAGAYAGQHDPIAHLARLKALFNAGLRTFFNLMEEDETNNDGMPFVPYDEQLQQIATKANERIECFRFPIVDRHITTHEHMQEILDAIDVSLENDRPVYVHCFGGIGRTGTVVSCWLLRHGFATASNVFELLKEIRQADLARASWPAPENETQRAFVLASANRPKIKRFQNKLPVASSNDWFGKLTGFAERSPNEVRENIAIRDGRLTSKVNAQSFQFGSLEIASLRELRERAVKVKYSSGNLQVAELVGDAKALHADSTNAGAMFQVASQFNLLEMVSPSVTPEQGIAIYENDLTQGPACAIACGAGTIYRNYFVELNGQFGQTASKQVDCLAAIGEALGNDNGRLWKMKNGYALPSAQGLKEVDCRLSSMSDSELDDLRGKLKVGLQWDTQVTLTGCDHLVTQAFCSALPVAYSGLPSRSWERFAKVILEAAYEATFAAAVFNASKTGNKSVYLTLLGGGAFGNDQEWILDAIRRAARLYSRVELDVKIVSFRNSNPAIRKLCQEL